MGYLSIALCLAITSNAFGGTRLPAINESLSQNSRVIEIVKWRQAVCVIPARDVAPCSSKENIQGGYNLNAGWSVEDESSQTKPIKAETSDVVPGTKGGIVNGTETLYNDVGRSTLEPSELVIDGNEELADHGRSSELLSKTPEMNVEWQSTRRNEPSIRLKTKSSRIFVTKVLDLPITATLVAHGCLPDIGFPLCADRQVNLSPKMGEYKLNHSVPREDEKSSIDYSREHVARAPLKLPESSFLNEKNRSSKVIEESTNFINNVITITEPIEDHNFDLGITELIEDNEPVASYDFSSSFEKLIQLNASPSGDANQFLNTLIYEYATEHSVDLYSTGFYSIYAKPLIDLLIRQEFNPLDKLRMKEAMYANETKDSCDKARGISVYKFRVCLIKYADCSNMLNEIAICLRGISVYTLRNGLSASNKSRSSQSIGSNIDHKINIAGPALKNNLNNDTTSLKATGAPEAYKSTKIPREIKNHFSNKTKRLNIETKKKDNPRSYTTLIYTIYKYIYDLFVA
ncbi:hypothetical protein PUN28_018934 [Cardiocondyla obscurior]|uniref:Uncharacterized protein n=1 Tax=Cardiocondyla obscurior TaxID=286306 RepID=A0AAW2ECM3_9HYME